MSLKAIHLVFITVSTLLATGFGIWALHEYSLDGTKLNLAFGIGSFLSVVALVAYGRYFLKKFKHISYL